MSWAVGAVARRLLMTKSSYSWNVCSRSMASAAVEVQYEGTRFRQGRTRHEEFRSDPARGAGAFVNAIAIAKGRMTKACDVISSRRRLFSDTFARATEAKQPISKRRAPNVRYVKAEYTPTPPPPPEDTPPPSEDSTPPQRPQYSPSNDSVPHQWLLYTIIGCNTVVFMAWQYAQECVNKHKDPGPYFFMYKNFLSGTFNSDQGRWWTYFTSCISHETFDHFLFNMLSLAFMSPPILALVGPTVFTGLYFGSGAACSFISIGWNKYITPTLHKDEAKQAMDPKQYLRTSQGASGSIYAVITTFALLSPHTKFLIFFILPVPAWLTVSGLFAYDFISALTRPDRRVDSAGHVGGVFSGYLFWKLVLGGLRFRRY